MSVYNVRLNAHDWYSSQACANLVTNYCATATLVQRRRSIGGRRTISQGKMRMKVFRVYEPNRPLQRQLTQQVLPEIAEWQLMFRYCFFCIYTQRAKWRTQSECYHFLDPRHLIVNVYANLLMQDLLEILLVII